MKSVVLVSGGIDSAVLLRHLLQQGPCVALSFNYGQRHGVQELTYAYVIARHVRHEVVDVPDVRRLFNSSQTSEKIEVPEGHYTEEKMKQTVVASRNLFMLAVAIGWGQTFQFDQVAYAAHGGDHTIYPDCRPEFVTAVDAVSQISDWHSIRVVAPFIQWTKAEIVARGHYLGVNFAQTWSCYKGLDVHCGKCGTCVERREAFQIAKVTDPTTYA